MHNIKDNLQPFILGFHSLWECLVIVHQMNNLICLRRRTTGAPDHKLFLQTYSMFQPKDLGRLLNKRHVGLDIFFLFFHDSDVVNVNVFKHFTTKSVWYYHITICNSVLYIIHIRKEHVWSKMVFIHCMCAAAHCVHI